MRRPSGSSNQRRLSDSTTTPAAPTRPGLPTPTPSSGWVVSAASSAARSTATSAAMSPVRAVRPRLRRTSTLPARFTRAPLKRSSSLRSRQTTWRLSGTIATRVAGLPTDGSTRRPTSSTSPSSRSSATRSEIVTRVRWVARARSARLVGPFRNSHCSTRLRLWRRASSGSALVVARNERCCGSDRLEAPAPLPVPRGTFASRPYEQMRVKCHVGRDPGGRAPGRLTVGPISPVSAGIAPGARKAATGERARGGKGWEAPSPAGGGGAAEQLAVAQHGDGTIVTHDDDRRQRVVEAVPAPRGVAHAAVALDRRLGVRTGDEPHAELAERALLVEHGRPVDLAEGVAEGRQLHRPGDLQRRRLGQAHLERGIGAAVAGSIDEDGADTARPEVVDGELEQRLQHPAVAVRAARIDSVDPGRQGRLVVPAQAVPAQHAEVPSDPYRVGRMAL